MPSQTHLPQSNLSDVNTLWVAGKIGPQGLGSFGIFHTNPEANKAPINNRKSVLRVCVMKCLIAMMDTRQLRNVHHHKPTTTVGKALNEESNVTRVPPCPGCRVQLTWRRGFVPIWDSRECDGKEVEQHNFIDKLRHHECDLSLPCWTRGWI